MRVCHVIHDLRRGGAEHLLADLAPRAAGAGMEMSVVSLMPAEGHAYTTVLERTGVEVRSLDLRSRWDPRAVGRLASLLRDLRPDVVHTHLKHADLVGVRAAGRLGIPVVSSLHVVEDAVGLMGRVKRGLAMRARDRGAARIVAVSSALRDWYLSLSDRGPETVVVLRNGVPPHPPATPAGRTQTRRRLGIPEGAVMAVTVVILRAGKGIEDLLAAIGLIGEETDIRFVVAGSGPEEAALRAEAERRGLLGTRVAFPGFVEDVPGLLAAADLMVHPSHADALSTALLHAMAAGLPSVATDVGGTREIVTDEVGLLVPPASPPDLADAIKRLGLDPGLRSRLGQGAVERFAAEFDIGVWVCRLLEIYREVISEH